MSRLKKWALIAILILHIAVPVGAILFLLKRRQLLRLKNEVHTLFNGA